MSALYKSPQRVTLEILGTGGHRPAICCPGMVSVVINEQVQLKPAASEEAEDRIFPGKTSPIISHGTGPRPKEKKAMYPKEQTSANLGRPETKMTK